MMARVAALVSPRVTLEAVDIASQLHETIVKKNKDNRNLYNIDCSFIEYLSGRTYGSVTPEFGSRNFIPDTDLQHSI
jgi:hypothetical protein